jgi:GH24 family phage-related lysozyme (muramidase)
MTRQINQAGLDLIKLFEGYEAKAYLDPVNVPTIGYGHTRTVTGKDVQEGRKITKTKAEALLKQDCASAEAAVERLIIIEPKLNDNEFAALVSFTFNLGAGSLKSSTLRRKLNSGDRDSVPSELAKWVKAGGKTLRGLVRRRNAEAELFVTPSGQSPTSAAAVPAMDNAHRVTHTDTDSCSEPHNGQAYLRDDQVLLERDSVDDTGAIRYLHLNQNVPDGYVVALQRDLVALGFGGDIKVDGAFGRNTLVAVRSFERAAGIATDGIIDNGTRQAIALWLQAGYTKLTPPGGFDDHFDPILGGMRLISPRVPHFSQGDSRWGDRLLGRSSSISKQGCAIACIAMILRYHGRNVDPEMLDIYLDANTGYQGNSVKWGVAGNCKQAGRKKLKYDRKDKGSEDNMLETLKKRIIDNKPTLVRVDYGFDLDIRYNHFVCAVGMTEQGDIIMNDPATRKGDGYENPGPENIIQQTTRKQGYKIVALDFYDPD